MFERELRNGIEICFFDVQASLPRRVGARGAHHGQVGAHAVYSLLTTPLCDALRGVALEGHLEQTRSGFLAAIAPSLLLGLVVGSERLGIRFEGETACDDLGALLGVELGSCGDREAEAIQELRA